MSLILHCVFHGIDLRLTGLVVGRQSIFFAPLRMVIRFSPVLLSLKNIFDRSTGETGAIPQLD